MRYNGALLLRTILLLFSLKLGGCAFIAIESNATRFIDNPHLSTERAKLICDKNASPETIAVVSKQRLKKAWGEADSVDVSHDIERWTYKTDARWNGLWGVIGIIPIPLLIPTGHEYMIVEIFDGAVSGVEVHCQGGNLAVLW